MAFLTAFTVLTLFLFTYHHDERRFENICANLFREEMTSSTLNMHYTIADPHLFGIDDYEAVLPCYSGEGHLEQQAALENMISILNSLNTKNLSAKNKQAHALLVKSLENSFSMNNYLYFEEPLAPSSGMQSQLPILLAEYTFRTEQDVKDYLKLLDQTDEYFASLLVFEQEKAAAGLLMPSSSLKKVITQCDTILDKKSLEEETHFLQSTFRERLIGLITQDIISLDTAKQYVVQNNRLLRTVMQPAYEALADGLCLLLDDTIPLTGLASHEGGAEYYELLLLTQTGSSRPIPELEEMLLNQLTAESAQIKDILKKNPDLLSEDYMAEIADVFPYQNATQMLADLQYRIQQDFPALLETSVTVKPVSASLQEYCAPAFYLTPPLDDITQNVIYINEKNPPSALELYTTLAHEGYPGHLYQSVFHNSLQNNSPASQVRSLLWYGGYLEGWALYVEFISFDYASQILKERGYSLLATAVQLEKHNRSLLLCLYSLIDMMIHYENASMQQISGLLDSFGINLSAAAAIYEYIVEEPANYPKYYIGYLEILKLKENAIAEWQDAYTDYAFHSFYLESGPADFASLQEWLKNQKATDYKKSAVTSEVL